MDLEQYTLVTSPAWNARWQRALLPAEPPPDIGIERWRADMARIAAYAGVCSARRPEEATVVARHPDGTERCMTFEDVVRDPWLHKDPEPVRRAARFLFRRFGLPSPWIEVFTGVREGPE